MEIVSVCLIFSATLIIQPDRTQFHLDESFNLTCVGNSSTWTVIRNTSDELETCEQWANHKKNSCINKNTYKFDSGSYWCQSKEGQCSDALSITVNSGVILESPALPVTEGNNVTLRCSIKENYRLPSSSDFKANFFRNGTFIGMGDNGKMTLTMVPKYEGFYKCEHPVKGKSEQSWLAVRVKPPHNSNLDPPLLSWTKLLFSIIVTVIYTIIFIVCVYIYRKWSQARADRKRASDQL